MSGCPAELIERDTRTCAQWRKEAQRLEDALDWGAASHAWGMAIRKHPGHGAKEGTMYADDLAHLERQRRVCEESCYREHPDKGRTIDGRRACTSRHPLGWTELLILD